MTAARPVVTLHDVVTEAHLGLSPIVPGRPESVITGAHTSDIHHPAEWLAPNTVLLTTGLRFVNAQREELLAVKLVDELRKAGVAALFFGIGVYFDEVPAQLVAACHQVGFPLYRVAHEVPFFRIENYINESQTAPDAYVQKRALWLSNDLMQSLSAEDPVKSLISRLATACRGTAVLYDASGRIVESSGDGPLHLIWKEVQAGDSVAELIEIGRWAAMVSPTVLKSESYTLAVASMNHRVLRDLGELLLETTQRLLAAIQGVAQFSDTRSRHESMQLLTMLQDGVAPAREFRHWERMRAFRFIPYQRVRALVASNVDDAVLDPVVAELLQRRGETSGLGLLLAENGRSPDSPPGFHAIVSDSVALEPWLELLGDMVFVGLSEPFADLVSTPEAFLEAEAAAGIARRQAHAMVRIGRPLCGRTVRLDEVDPATWLLGRKLSSKDRSKLSSFTRAIDGDQELKDTLVRYLADDLDVATTAAGLFVHPNTVRYRLRKVESLIGGSLSNAHVITNLYLACHDDIIALRSESSSLAAIDS